MAGAGIDPVHVVVARVAGDLFATLGVYPDVGRAFSPEEMAAGTPVVVLGHGLWQRRFSGDRTIVGRTVTIDGAPHTVIGVMPAGRGYPSDARGVAAVDGQRTRRQRPRTEHGGTASKRDDRRAGEHGDRYAGAGRVQRRAHGVGRRLQRTDVGNVSAAIQALFAAAMLTLLIACANVAALVGARGADRAGEMAVRGALGATRARVLGQLITESLVLALAGGALGLLFGRWALDASSSPWRR